MDSYPLSHQESPSVLLNCSLIKRLPPPCCRYSDIPFVCHSPTPLELMALGVGRAVLCPSGSSSAQPCLPAGLGRGSSCWLRSALLIGSLILPWPDGGRQRRGISQEIGVPTVCECRPVAQGSVLWQPGQLLSWWGLLRVQGEPWNLGW